jgi:hypothetical protein
MMNAKKKPFLHPSLFASGRFLPVARGRSRPRADISESAQRPRNWPPLGLTGETACIDSAPLRYLN